MQGNKEKSYQFKEGEEGLYHLKLVRKTYISKEKRVKEDISFQSFTKKEYEQFKKFKPANIDEVYILHDPTIKTVKKEK